MNFAVRARREYTEHAGKYLPRIILSTIHTLILPQHNDFPSDLLVQDLESSFHSLDDVIGCDGWNVSMVAVAASR